jgi:ribonuclease HII
MTREMLDRDLELCLKLGGGFVGCDEVGRGCLAGPVGTCGVYLDLGLIKKYEALLLEAKDSKTLSKAKLAKLALALIASDIPIDYHEVGPEYIDRHNILRATMAGFAHNCQVLVECDTDFFAVDTDVREIVVDGNQPFEFKYDIPVTTLVKGDSTSAAVACASIVAKYSRDLTMAKLSHDHPGYGFEKHVGYGTKDHIEAIKRLGPCAIHRRSFEPLKSLFPVLP